MAIGVDSSHHLQLAGSAALRVRRGFSVPHLCAAEHFAADLQAYERQHSGEAFGDVWERARWYASAAILMAFSSIEAVLDETEDDLGIPEGLLRPIQRAPFWERVAAVYAFIGAPPPTMGSEPYQSADLLRALRNGLAHPKAEWDDAQASHKALTKRLLAARLPLSPFIDDPKTAFPHGCMSAGVAQWAADTARAFTREFCARCGLKARV